MNQETSDTGEKIPDKLLRWLFVGFKLSEIERAGLSVEGKIITARNVLDYAGSLNFSVKSLDGKKVLDFGCGASNIGEDLKAEGVNATVVGVDLNFDPYSNRNGIPLMETLVYGLSLLTKSMPVESRTRENIVRLKRRLAGTAERLFVQADGRHLPFADQSFDKVLALQSTYQIPFEHRVRVFEELLRVGKSVHIYPIFGEDFDALSKLAKEKDFEIVECVGAGKVDIPGQTHRPRMQEPHFDVSALGGLRPNFTFSSEDVVNGEVCRIVLKKK